jgi:DNA-binding transcriptional LysR family regulator
LTLERDFQNEWQFMKSQMRQRVKFAPKLLVQGADSLRDAAVAGLGLVRIRACNVEDEIRSRKLIRILSAWECGGAGPMAAIYRKARPMPPRISEFVRHLAEAFRSYNYPPKSDGR